MESTTVERVLTRLWHFMCKSQKKSVLIELAHYFASQSNNTDTILEKNFEHTVHQYRPNAILHVVFFLRQNIHHALNQEEDTALIAKCCLPPQQQCSSLVLSMYIIGLL